jgi:hypothetical protein
MSSLKIQEIAQSILPRSRCRMYAVVLFVMKLPVRTEVFGRMISLDMELPAA